MNDIGSPLIGPPHQPDSLLCRVADAGVSFVIPCLNEAATLGGLLQSIEATIRAGEFGNRPVEVIVCDNGSNDDSADIARSHGAVIVDCPVLGYGAALRYGIMVARYQIIIMLDADLTYDAAEAPRLASRLTPTIDMVLGDRLHGQKIDGAMPWLHRYVGTPILTGLINRLFAGRSNRILDCNCGYRCFWRDAFISWNLTSDGMEIASEMLVSAIKKGSSIVNEPVSLRPAPPERIPHLRTWRDGMRHLLQILLASPESFFRVGLTAMAMGWCGLLLSLAGPLPLYDIKIFGPHTAILCTLAALIGQDIWVIGLFISMRSGDTIRWYRWFLSLDESTLFWILAIGLLSLTGGIAIVFFVWAANDFLLRGFLSDFIVGATFFAQAVQLLTSLLAGSLVKRVVSHNAAFEALRSSDKII